MSEQQPDWDGGMRGQYIGYFLTENEERGCYVGFNAYKRSKFKHLIFRRKDMDLAIRDPGFCDGNISCSTFYVSNVAQDNSHIGITQGGFYA